MDLEVDGGQSPRGDRCSQIILYCILCFFYFSNYSVQYFSESSIRLASMSGYLLHLLLCTKHLFLASIQIIQMKMGPRDVWCIMQPKLTCGLKVIRGNLSYNIFQCYLAAPMFVHNGLMTALMSYLTAPMFTSAYMISPQYCSVG